MAEQREEEKFKEMLKKNITDWANDSDTTKFADYFVGHYANRPKQWAACYRLNAHINTNMAIERWHKELKHNSDLEGKCGGRLDKSIQSIMKSLKLKLINRKVTLTRGKVTKKV